jgi:hypothetical protein
MLFDDTMGKILELIVFLVLIGFSAYFGASAALRKNSRAGNRTHACKCTRSE